MRALIILCLLLTGCATKVAQTFTPFAVEIQGPVGQKHLSQDMKLCQGYAYDYLHSKPPLDVSQIASGAVTGGLSDLGYLGISPVAPALGGLGGASGETLSELGFDTKEAKKVITICLHDKGVQSNYYHIYDPNQ